MTNDLLLAIIEEKDREIERLQSCLHAQEDVAPLYERISELAWGLEQISKILISVAVATPEPPLEHDPGDVDRRPGDDGGGHDDRDPVEGHVMHPTG
jgi:hypothetical protein